MDVYKDFIQNLRRKCFEGVHILLCNISPKLTEYVRLLTEVKFQDGSYYTYYGDVKTIVGSFMHYFNRTVVEVVIDADRYSDEISKDELMALMEKTISTHQSNQSDFVNNFLPVTSPSDKLIYKEIEGQYNDYMMKMDEFREKLDKLQKKENIVEFAKDHFPFAVKRTTEIFNYTYIYFVTMLVDSLDKIRTSLEEILFRMSNNFREEQEECDESLNHLLHQLYDKNKESLYVCRSHARRSTDMAEVECGIQKIRDKIDSIETEVPLARLDEEVTYWQDRLKGFNEIAFNIAKIQMELDNVTREEKIHNSLRTADLLGSKHSCWLNMGDNFTKQKKYLNEKINEEGRPIMTFFSCRGTDRIRYTDNIGPYHVDEYNHKIYEFDYGLRMYHLGSNGIFKQPLETEYYFDKYGRYIMQDGQKLYQSAHCTSLYKLEEDGLLTKVPVNKVAKDTKNIKEIDEYPDPKTDITTNDHKWMEIKDPEDVAVLPDFDPMEIKRSLDNETVKYLWNSFGSILPDALHDVEKAKSKNPIHFLAHKLLFHKYSKTLEGLSNKKKEAEEFRVNIMKDRKEKAIAVTKAWKSKQVKRRKTEESDDTQASAVYDAQKAHEAFINSLSDYYY